MVNYCLISLALNTAGCSLLRINSPVRTVREATGTSGVDNEPAPDWQTQLNGIISLSESG